MNLIITALSRHHCEIWIVVVLLTPVDPTIAAAIVIESFGPGNTYDTTSGLLIGDISGPDPKSPSVNSEWAIRFDVPGSAPFKIDTIQIAARYFGGTPNQMDIQIRTDTNGSPGQIIDSLSFTNITDQPDGQVLTGTPEQMAVLSPAGRYWLSASAPGVLNKAILGWSSQPANGIPRPAANRIDGGPWQVINESSMPGVFRITGIQIPESSTSILLLASSVHLWILRRR